MNAMAGPHTDDVQLAGVEASWRTNRNRYALMVWILCGQLLSIESRTKTFVNFYEVNFVLLVKSVSSNLIVGELLHIFIHQ